MFAAIARQCESCAHPCASLFTTGRAEFRIFASIPDRLVCCGVLIFSNDAIKAVRHLQAVYPVFIEPRFLVADLLRSLSEMRSGEYLL